MSRKRQPPAGSWEIQRLGSEEALRCPLCLETFETPRALACLHTFCEPCLEYYIQDLKSSVKDGKLDKIQCPICKHQTVPPDVLKHPHAMVKDFPLNHYILPLLDGLTPRGRSRDAARGKRGVNFVQCCGSCTERGRAVEAVAYCQDCEDFQCAECIENHTKIKMLSSHRIIGTDRMANGSETAKSLEKHNICIFHQNQDARFYCANHDVLLCSDCTIARHKACEILTEFEDLGLKIKQGDQQKKLKENMKGLQKGLNDMIEAMRTNNYGLKRESEEIPKRIQNMKAKVIRLFQYLEETADEKILNFKEEYFKRNAEMAYRFKQLLVSIEASNAAMETVLEHGTYQQMFRTFHKLKAQLQEYDDMVKVEKEKLTCVTIQLKMEDALDTVVSALDQLGDVFIQSIKPDLAELPPLLFARREDSFDDLKPELVKTALLKTPDVNITRDCIAATYMDKKLALVFEVKNRTWFSYTLSLVSTDKMEEIHTQDLKRDPKNIICIDSNNLAITFPKGGFIEFYLFTARRKKKPMKLELNHTVKCDIRDTIVTRYNKKEFALSTCNHFGTMTHEGVVQQMFYYSISLRVRETDFWSTQLIVEHIVVDFKKKRVYVAASKPDKLFSFTTRGEVMFDLAFDWPIKCLDLDPEGNVIVCSGTESAGKVSEISPNTGKLLKVVATNETHTPQLTCYNKKGSDFYLIQNGKKTRLDKYRYNINEDEDLFHDD
ncbi:uncharacterized protein LOC127843980 [Dreissena polymorpha]|uniref:Uncharacterized protein n=1 Tax=Dreissena polymorpha TaxID=45954 RepID=A0A9D4N530_DREPO|nr:uncharacterized protein LOC127843980 [Dreissena polymorpha]KAH3887424.1 hypothetical protein DPMN_011441 [Dreissena polymorpha]